MKKLSTEIAFAIWAFFLVLGYAWATVFPQAPFSAFSVSLTGGLGVIVGKRLWQKDKRFNSHED